MKYIFPFLYLFILLLEGGFSLYAEDLSLDVPKVWTLDSAKNEAFSSVEERHDLSIYTALDPNFIENQRAIREKQTHIGTRTLTVFLNGKYYSVSDAVTDHTIMEYYRANGRLFGVEYNTGNHLPKKYYKYKFPTGELMSVTIDVDADNTFVFNANGQLIWHLKGEQCFLPNGKYCTFR